jgi:flagellar biosynthesis/type III secretory pathway protein FliH
MNNYIQINRSDIEQLLKDMQFSSYRYNLNEYNFFEHYLETAYSLGYQYRQEQRSEKDYDEGHKDGYNSGYDDGLTEEEQDTRNKVKVIDGLVEKLKNEIKGLL